MSVHPPVPCLVHELSTAPTFVGREKELVELCDCWGRGFRGVVSLVGFGGEGKTALAARFVARLLAHESSLPNADGVFVWSSTKIRMRVSFWASLIGTSCGPRQIRSPTAKGIGLLHFLNEALGAGRTL